MKRTWTTTQLRRAIEVNNTWSGVLRDLGIVSSGNSFIYVKRRALEQGFDTSHFLGKSWAKGLSRPELSNPVNLSNVLIKNSSYNTLHLKNRLFREGIKQKRCERCKRKTWLGHPIPLELDHINGVRNDHRLDNLRVLCPNCHALTGTWRGRKLATNAKSRAKSPSNSL